MLTLLDKWYMSYWAYWQCSNGNDTKQLRSLLVDQHRFCYCAHIRDIKEVWSKIRESTWAQDYCDNVKDRPEIRQYIKKVFKK